MSKGFRITVLMIGTVVCLLAAGGQSRGYVLFPEHILTLMLKKTVPPQAFMVKQHLFLDQIDCDAEPAGSSRIEETVWYQAPGRFRSEVMTGDSRRIYVVSQGEAVTIAGGKVVSTRENSLMAYHLPLAFRDRQSLSDDLHRFGVDMTISSLGRWQEELFFVIGAGYPDGSAPQLWINKESFLPWRFLVREAVGEGRMLEARYMDWQRRSGFWYPMRIEVYHEGMIQRVICVASCSRTGDLGKDFFNISALKAIHPAAGPEATGDTVTSDAEDDIGKMLDDFRKMYQ